MNLEILNHLYRCNKEFSHGKIRKTGLSDTEYIICAFVNSHDNCSQDDVARSLKIDKTTVGKALQCLEDKKCVTRVSDDKDRRKKCLSLTEEGRKRIKNIINIHNEWGAEVIKCLSDEEQAQFEEYLQRILENAKALGKS